MVGVTDEMLRAVDDEVLAGCDRRGFHAAQIGTGTGFGHGETFGPVAAHRGEKIALPLFAGARQKDVGRPAHAGVVQRVVGAPEFLLVQNPGHGVDSGAPTSTGMFAAYSPASIAFAFSSR